VRRCKTYRCEILSSERVNIYLSIWVWLPQGSNLISSDLFYLLYVFLGGSDIFRRSPSLGGMGGYRKGKARRY
jgi:hypothetical protein